MRVEKFNAPSMAEALAHIRRRLGDDALILEISPLNEGGFEVTAGIEPAVRSPAPAARPKETPIVAPSRGRVVALVGPTGAGKTTTVAKLAARAALLEGQQVAVVTLDTYRLGGAQQLRGYTDLIGVPLVVVEDPRRLQHTLGRMQWAERVFVDTPGRSPRDVAALRVLGEALSEIPEAEVHLTIPAVLHGRAIDRLLQWPGRARIDRLLFTKIDEAFELDELRDCPRRSGIPLTYLTTGQRVPEDIECSSTTRIEQLIRDGFARHQEAA